MAAGRNKVDYTGIGYDAMSYEIDNSTITYDATKVNGSAAVGLAVTLSADDTVALAADGDAIEGKLLAVAADGFCTVQTEGYCELPAGNGATVTRGTRALGALGAASAKGYIRNAASGTATELVKDGPFIINVADTTKVVVEF